MFGQMMDVVSFAAVNGIKGYKVGEVSKVELIWFHIEIFGRMLAVHCDRNNSYQITMNGYQARKINEMIYVSSVSSYGKPSSGEVHQVEYLMRSKYFGENLA